MAKNGRPPALDDTDRREIAAVLSTGCSVRVAANFVGCSRSTIYRELANNQAFYDQVRHLQVATLLGPLKTIHNAAKTNWRAAAWLSERLNPHDFGRRHPEMVDPEDVNLTVQVAIRELKEVIGDPKILRKLTRRIQRLMIDGIHLRRTEKYRPRPPKLSDSKQTSSRPNGPTVSSGRPVDEDVDEFDEEDEVDELEAEERIALHAQSDLAEQLEREEIEEEERERNERTESADGSPPDTERGTAEL